MKTLPIRNVPYGTAFKAFGDEFIALDYIDGAVLAIRKDTWKRAPFDKAGCNDLRKASVLSELTDYFRGLMENGLKESDTNIATIDLKATDGTREYGAFGMRAALLTLEQYGKYQHIIPNVDSWWWLATPCWTPAQKGGDATYAWLVYTNGSYNHYNCTLTYGIRPALYFTPSLLVSIADDDSEPAPSKEDLYRDYREYVKNLLCIYIDTTEGLPLGYQTSQLFALLFLDDFDHWIKERWGIRFYGRYMDDFYIIARTKKELQIILAAIREYMAEAGLELNEKTGIFPLQNGIDFLGFHTYLTGTGGVVQKLRRDSIQRMKGRIRTWREEYPAGKITKEKIIEQWTSWDAHAAHGDTHALREKIAGQVGDIIGEKLTPRRKITSSDRVKALRKARAARQQAKKQGGSGASPFGTFSSEPRPDTILPWE